MSSSFVKGLELSSLFFEEVVKDILSKFYPSLRYAAALLGPGSEVLGFDDQVSTDHHWGPRAQLFLHDDDLEKYSDQIKSSLSRNLPYTFNGYSTNWSEPDPNDSMNQFLENISSGPVNHRIDIVSVKSYLKQHLDIESVHLSDIEWLILPEQKLLEFTSGEIFHSKLGTLSSA